MKGKLKSIGRVAMALVLAVSLGLVMALPAVGQVSSNYIGVVLDEFMGDSVTGTASWVADPTASGNYAVELTTGAPSASEVTGTGRILLAYNQPLSTITDLGYSYKLVDGNGTANWDSGPYMVLALDTNADEEADRWVVHHMFALSPGKGTWLEWELDMEIPTEHMVTGEGAMWHVPGDTNYADWAAVVEEYGDATVLELKIAVGGWTSDINTGHYVDDLQINGTTYDLEPMVLDAEYYSTGEAVTVTVLNGNASGTIFIDVYSTTVGLDNKIMVALSETGTGTGVFTGSFDLVDTTPGTGELLVNDGDILSVQYTGGWGAGEQELPYVDPPVATVDDTLPVVAIDTPTSDEDYVAGSVSIAWTIDDKNRDTVELLINDVPVVDAMSGGNWVTDEMTGDEADWPDGAYTIEVVATDAAGNVGSSSIAVTVDNTDPVIGDQVATPAVVEPDVANTIVFTAEVTDVNINTVTIDLSSIDGLSAEPMLDDGVAPDATADDGIYTAEITATIAVETTYYLPVTATDLATNSVPTSGDDRLQIVVSSDIVAPVITDPAITYPFAGVNSAQPNDSVTISATVTDDVLMGSVTAVCDAFIEVDVSKVIDLLDNGADPDVTADDGIYTGTATVDETAGWGDYAITITATDDKGNVATDETLTLAVRTGATGEVINLEAGWNLISLPLIPGDSDITVVISDTTLASEDVSSVGIVRGYDLATGEFPAYIPGTGGELTTMEDGIGYWVFMVEADTLTVTGTQWPAPPEVPPTYDVVVGWNLIGFKSIENDSFANYLANIVDTYPVLWSYNATAGAYENVKGLGGGMVVGHGFWIWINEPGTIVPPQ